MHGQARIVSGYIPKYRQLVDILRNRILSGEYSPGERMPTEDDLSSTYEVSRGTVRKAIAQLEAERLVHSEQGVGSFVQQMHPRAVPFRLLDPAADGQRLTHEVLAREVIAAPFGCRRTPAGFRLENRWFTSRGGACVMGGLLRTPFAIYPARCAQRSWKKT